MDIDLEQQKAFLADYHRYLYSMGYEIVGGRTVSERSANKVLAGNYLYAKAEGEFVDGLWIPEPYKWMNER